MEHPERVRRQYDNNDIQTVGIMQVLDDIHAPGPHVSGPEMFSADVRLLLDYLGVQYLDPDINAAMHRVRKVVGYHT